MRQAVLIAKQIPGTPVKLIWSREEDMLHGTYHPITQCRMVGAFDKDNNLVGLHMRISGQSILASVRPEGLQHPTIVQSHVCRRTPVSEHSTSRPWPGPLLPHQLKLFWYDCYQNPHGAS